VTTIRGACAHDCPDTCSWLVDIEDGTAKRLYGDPAHPFTRGGLCAKVNHYLDRVYHPDRVLHPLKRSGPKGSGQFQRVSWDEALADIASRWKSIPPEELLLYSLAGTQGLIQMASLDRRLFGSMGACGLERNICGEVAVAGLEVTQGHSWGIDPEDIVHSRYIVLWGTNTIVTNLHLWPFIQQARERGARLIVVDPVRTRTAEQADWHIPLKPASDGALALAMMHVWVRDGLVDLDYVRSHTEGYGELVEYLRSFPPAAVADVTGISADDIELFAREYAATRPSLLRPLIGIEHHRNGGTLFRTLAMLPILLGAWRERGGGLFRSSGSLQYSTLNTRKLWMPEVYKPGVRVLNMANLGNDLCSAEPPIRSLFVHSVNPMVTVPNRNRIRQGLLRDDLFTVVHDLFITETAAFADYVLPATSQIEHLDIVTSWGHHYLSFNHPAIAPRGEAVSNTELARRLARALGRAEPWLFDSDEDLLRQALDSDHPWLEGITYENLAARGYQKLAQPEDWRPYANGGFHTPAGKANLHPERIGPGEIVAADRDYPLQLITGKSLHFLNSSYGNMERHLRRSGPLFVEIHPADARSRNLEDGAAVKVANASGQLSAICRITDRVRQGVVSMPFGGAYAVNELTPEMPTDWGGGSGFYDAFVEVHP